MIETVIRFSNGGLVVAVGHRLAYGERPTIKAVYKALRGRGSPNHITCMQRFWKDQAALNQGDPTGPAPAEGT